MDSDLSAEGAAMAARSQCLQAAREHFAYVTFLHTNEYLIVRGNFGEGALRDVVGQRDLKNAPGTRPCQLYCLPSLKDCTGNARPAS